MTTEYDYTYTVAGPPKAQGRHRARYVKYKIPRGKSEGFIHFYDDPESKKEKDHIAMLLRRSAPPKPLECALRVDIVFHMPRPKSHYRTGKYSHILKPDSPTHHKSKPDIDNLRKLLMDALTGILWKDDCIICQGEPIKRYSENPRTEIFIKVLSEEKESEEKTLWQEKQNP